MSAATRDAPSSGTSAPDAVRVLGVGAFSPGYARLEALVRGVPETEHEDPDASLIPRRQRRRASLLSKAFAHAYAQALEQAGLDGEQVASVFGSALGEAATMVALLDQMWSAEAPLSPMRFATSVHNTASGMVSIATGNRGFTTSMGADFDTPAMALLEGIGLVHTTGRPVVVCCCDEAPPAGLVTGRRPWALLAVAIAIGPAETASTETSSRLSGLALEPGEWSPPEMDGAIDDNPAVGLLDLARAIHAGHSGRVALDRGPGRGYSIHVDGPDA